MLKIDGITDLNQISLTGIRSLILISLLVKAPRSLEEIREEFIRLKIMEPSQSNDILRIDLNTIKAMGCEISRSCARTNFKYVLTKQPFSIYFSEDDIKLLKRIYDKIKASADILLLLEYDKLFVKISNYIFDEKLKEDFLGISVLKRFNTDLINELISDCQKEIIEILEYKKPTSVNTTKKEIIAHEVVFRNDKVYLHGYDLNKKAPTVLSMDGIKSIISKKQSEEKHVIKSFDVTFLLENDNEKTLSKEETVLEKSSNFSVIKGKYFNEFLATQRILSFGSECVVQEPTEFRNNIIAKLKEMRDVYER